MALPLRIAPLISYTGSFAVWPGTLVAGDRKAPAGCIAPSEGALMLAGRGESNATLGQMIGASRQLVGMWGTAARFPADEHLATMEAKLGIPAIAWQLWRSTALAAPPPEAPPPKPEAKPRDAEQPPAGAGTAPEDSSLARVRELIRELRGEVMTAEDIGQRRLLLQALAHESKLTGAVMSASKAKLHDHPDWAGVIDNLVTALGPVPGALDVLDGFLTKYAEDNKQ